MEEKGSVPLMGSHQGTGFQSSSLLTSVRLQFLAGCFGLGTVGHAGAKGESVRLHHYQVCILMFFLLFQWVIKMLSVLTVFICLTQDGIRAAKRSIQIEIQVAVHKIYQQLSATLERALQANKHHIGK